MKTILLFSNPFGYGPTGKLLAVAKHLSIHSEYQLIVAGSGLCAELAKRSNLTVEEVDERNETAIAAFLARFNPQHTRIFSSQNRFAIKAGQQAGFTCFFLDGLAWFWKNIPEDHLLADTIFWLRYPEIAKKIPAHKPIVLIGAILDLPPKHPVHSNEVLVHVGGIKNPLDDALPTAYLELLAHALNTVESARTMFVTGGQEAISFLGSRVQNPRVHLESLSQVDFLQKLSRASLLLTTAGQTAVLESFATGCSVSFLPPTNLSQLSLTDTLEQYGAADRILAWEQITTIPEQLRHMTEKEAIQTLKQIAQSVIDDPILQQIYLQGFQKLLDTPTTGDLHQKEFIEKMGQNGAQTIAAHIMASLK